MELILKPFEKASQNERGLEDILQLGFLGRLEHNQKGGDAFTKIG